VPILLLVLIVGLCLFHPRLFLADVVIVPDIQLFVVFVDLDQTVFLEDNFASLHMLLKKVRRIVVFEFATKV